MKYLVFLSVFLIGLSCFAKVKVVTSTSTLRALVEEIGGEFVEVTSLSKVNQDPHYLEAKPSYMVKVRKADLFVSIGFDLESGWIDLVLRGSRNPDLLDTNRGHLVAENFVKAIDIPSEVDRSKGHVHAKGNPHFHFDPDSVITFAEAIAQRLSLLDSSNKESFLKSFQAFKSKLDSKVSQWKGRIKSSGVQSVVTYHSSFDYFTKFFGLKLTGYIEPVPGSPPTARQIIELIKKMKSDGTHCILNESYFEKSAAQRINKSYPVSIHRVPVEADSNYFTLIETLVMAIEICGKAVVK